MYKCYALICKVPKSNFLLFVWRLSILLLLFFLPVSWDRLSWHWPTWTLRLSLSRCWWTRTGIATSSTSSRTRHARHSRIWASYSSTTGTTPSHIDPGRWRFLNHNILVPEGGACCIVTFWSK